MKYQLQVAGLAPLFAGLPRSRNDPEFVGYRELNIQCIAHCWFCP
jgi:hypothetical protein